MKGNILFLYTLLVFTAYVAILIPCGHAMTSPTIPLLGSDTHHCWPSEAPLFSHQGEEPMHVGIKADFDKVFDRSISPANWLDTQVDARITVRMPGEAAYDAKVKLRARGGSRFEDCTFRPLKLKISEKEQQRLDDLFPEHLFADLTREIKLTPICHKNDESRRALLKEQLVYGILGLSNTTTFSTNLAQLTFENEADFQSKNPERSSSSTNIPLAHHEWGFFIEPYDSLAKRCQLKKESKHIRQRYDNESKSFKWFILNDPNALPIDSGERKSFLRNKINWSPYEQFPEPMNLFQMHFFNRLIGNLDYHVDHRHNIKILIQPLDTFTKVRNYFVPYDFDISGAVNGGILTYSKTPQEAAQDFLLWINAYDLKGTVPRTWLKIFANREPEIMEMIANSYLDAKGKADLSSWFSEHLTAINTFLSIP